MKAGKYEVKPGKDSQGKIVYYLVETATGKVMPGHYTEMSLAVVAGLLANF